MATYCISKLETSWELSIFKDGRWWPISHHLSEAEAIFRMKSLIDAEKPKIEPKFFDSSGNQVPPPTQAAVWWQT